MTPEEQELFDDMFSSIVECEAALDEVIERLGLVDVVVGEGQRGVVQRWLEIDQRVPLVCRLATLRRMLK